jgi:hypothetical protein
MRRDCHVAYFSHPTVMQRETRTKNSFGLYSKDPFITDPFQPNLHCKWRTRSECHVVYFSHPTAMRGEIGRITLSAARVRCLSLLTAFNLTCTHFSAYAGSAMWHISVNSLQCEGIHGRESVSSSRLKCPSLMIDFNLPGTARDACAGCGMWNISVTPLPL